MCSRRRQLVPIGIRPVGFGRVGPDARLLEPRLIDRRLAQPHLVLPRAAAEDHAYTRRRLAVEALEAETDLPLGRLGIPGDMQAAHADLSDLAVPQNPRTDHLLDVEAEFPRPFVQKARFDGLFDRIDQPDTKMRLRSEEHTSEL